MKKLLLAILFLMMSVNLFAKSWQEYDLLSEAPADGDHLMINDVSDTTDDAAGTLKRLAWVYLQNRDSDLTSIAVLTTTAYGRALLELADEGALSALITSFLPLAGGILTGTITLDDGDVNSPAVIFKDETDEYWYLYKIDAGDFHLYTIHADNQTFAISNEGAGNANLAVDGTISEGGTSLVSKYQALEDQSLSTTDAPTFESVTTTAGATGNGGVLVDSLPDTNQTCHCVACSTETAGATIVFGDILTLDVTTGKYILANANSTALLYGRAVACGAADDTDPIEVMSIGWIRDDAEVFTDDINKHIVLDETAGAFVLEDGAIPADTGDLIQILGHVTAEAALGLNIDVWYFNPEYNGKILN